MAELVTQASAAPTRKVTYAAIGGAVATIVAYVAASYGGIELDEPVVAGITAIVAFVFAYFAREKA